MPSGRDIRAGGAFVEFTLRRKGLERSLRAVGRRMQRFGANVAQVGAKIAAIGGLISAPFALASKTFAKVGDDLEKMSRRTGITVEALSELGFAAQQSGTDMGTLERGIKTMQRNIVDLGRGLSTQKDAFDALGLSFERVTALSPEQQFTTIAEAIAGIDDPTERAARAMVVFGRAGQQLVPLLSDGAGGIAALRQEARDLGLTISGDTANKAAAFTDALGRIRSQAKVAAVNIGASLAPTLIKVFDVLALGGRAVIDFVKENKALILIVAGAGAALTALGLTVVGLGGAMILAGLAITKLAAIVGLLLSPLGLAAVAITAATVALLKFTNLGGQAAAFLQTKFSVLSVQVRRAFSGIADAVEGKDILLAARILWVNLKLIFFEGTQGLFNRWIDFKADFLKASEEAGAGVVGMLSNALAAVERLIAPIYARVNRFVGNVVGDARESFNLIVLLAKKAAADIRFALDPSFSQGDRAAADQRADSDFIRAQHQAQRDRRRNENRFSDKAIDRALQQIEAERVAREAAIVQSLNAELAAIDTAAEKDKERIQARIDALRAERAELERQAELARLGAQLKQKFRDVFLGGRGQQFDGAFNPDPGSGLASQVQAAAVAARGVTSSFNIRSLGAGGGLENNVQAIDRKAQQIQRHLRDISNNLKPGVQDGGLAIV